MTEPKEPVHNCKEGWVCEASGAGLAPRVYGWSRVRRGWNAVSLSRLSRLDGEPEPARSPLTAPPPHDRGLAEAQAPLTTTDAVVDAPRRAAVLCERVA